MALESLAAVSLAGNIFQFIDCACKLLHGATSIYQSCNGATQESQNLEQTTHRLQEISLNLQKSVTGTNTASTFTQCELNLRQLANQCDAATIEILTALQSVKAKSPLSKWQSFRAALITVWKEPQLKAMRKRVDSYRLDLILQLEMMSRDSQPGFLAILQEMNTKSQQLGTDLTDSIETLQAEFQDGLSMLMDKLNDLAVNKQRQTQEERLEPVQIGVFQPYTNQLGSTHLIPKLADWETSSLHIAAVLDILESLTYEQIEYRHSMIQPAHPETFEWVFSLFQSWLISPQSIFWFSGKPGSGKSTLMKFMVDHPETRTLLQNWSHSGQVLVANHFFWINGSKLQRSQEGLLRAILYDILRQAPYLIPSVLPEAWKGAKLTQTGRRNSLTPIWNKKELLKAFERLASVDISGLRMLIFIDGLDEYEGDHDDLIDTIKHLAMTGVKLCIASRPWNIFEDAFGQCPDYKIYLQDLNRPDIETYVSDHLRTLPEFKKLEANNYEAGTIATDIIQKSNGVFLWVFLVVRSLSEGLRNRDQLSQLQSRLRQFPNDLDGFFRDMFMSIDPTYRTQATHMFQVALAALEPPAPLTYWYLDEEEDEHDCVLSMQIGNITVQDITERTEEVARRINGRCKGLLEITEVSSSKSRRLQVDFLHRTVKDFFIEGLRTALGDWQDDEFNAHLAICKASLAEMKAIALLNKDVSPSGRLPFENFLHAANQLELSDAKMPGAESMLEPYFDALEHVLRSRNQFFSADPQNLRSWRFRNLNDAIASRDLLLMASVRFNKIPRHSWPAERARLFSDMPHVDPSQLSPDMIILMLSIGPRVKFDQSSMADIAYHVRFMSNDVLLTCMKRISQHAYIAMHDKRTVKSDALNSYLKLTLTDEQFLELMEFIRRANRAHESPFRKYHWSPKFLTPRKKSNATI